MSTFVPDWIDEIDFLLNQAPSLLGCKGSGFDPTAGSGSRTISDTSSYHNQRISAARHLPRIRRIEKIWFQLSALDRRVLSARYSHRQWVGVVGAMATFGALASVALAIAPDQGALVSALSDAKNSKHLPLVTKARRDAEAACKAAHAAWVQAASAEGWAQ